VLLEKKSDQIEKSLAVLLFNVKIATKWKDSYDKKAHGKESVKSSYEVSGRYSNWPSAIWKDHARAYGFSKA
jgi:hypothetical protein